MYELHNNAKIRRFSVVRQKVLKFWTLFTENTWHRNDSPLKQIVNLKSKQLSIPNKIIKDNQPITNSRVIANEFNHYFANIGHNWTLLQSETNYHISFSNYLNSPLLECFCLFPTSSIEIENIIPIKLLKLLKVPLRRKNCLPNFDLSKL